MTALRRRGPTRQVDRGAGRLRWGGTAGHFSFSANQSYAMHGLPLGLHPASSSKRHGRPVTGWRYWPLLPSPKFATDA